jgi:biopolymer transport protein ExbD
MKLPRTTKLFRGHLDPAPLLCVLFPVAFFALSQRWLILPAGTQLVLPPDANSVAEAAQEPSYILGIDAAERVFFENQLISDTDLAKRLQELLAQPGTPRALWIHADKSVTYGRLTELGLIAREAGIQRIYQATAPTRPSP